MSFHLLQRLNGTIETHEPTLHGLLKDLCNNLGELGTHLKERLLEKLQAIVTPEDLVTCCQACWRPQVLNATSNSDKSNRFGASAESPIGHFLRSCRLAFVSMPFESTVHMLTNVCGYYEVYCQEAAAKLRGESTEKARFACTRDLCPPKQIHSYLHHHAELVRQLTGVVPIDILDSKLSSLSNTVPQLPRVLATRMHSANLSKRYNIALDALAHYHDYAIPLATQLGAGGDPDTRTKPLQQALLSLSQIHADYGHMRHALLALLEAVVVAQGVGDTESLVMCLMHLCAVMRPSSPLKGLEVKTAGAAMQGAAPTHFHLLEQLLHRCALQALQHRLPLYFAYSALALAEHCMLHQEQPSGAASNSTVTNLRRTNGARLSYCVVDKAQANGAANPSLGIERHTLRGVSPSAVIWQYSAALTEMDFVCQLASFSCNTTPAPAALGAPASRTDVYTLHSDAMASCLQGAERAVAEAVTEARGRMHLLRCSAWRRHGCLTLAAAEACTVLTSQATDNDDSLTAYAHLALIANDLHGPQAAQKVLDAALSEFPLSTSPQIALAQQEVRYWQALRQGQYRRARLCATVMCTLPHPGGSTEMELRVQAEEMLVRIMFSSGQCVEAWHRGVKLLANCVTNGLQVEAASVQLTIAHALQKAEQPALALPYVLNALYHATALHLDVLAAHAVVTLAQIKLDISISWALHARKLVKEHLNLIEAQGGLALRAEAHLLLAETFLRSTSKQHICEVRPEIELHLTQAVSACEGAEWWTLGYKAASLLAIARKGCSDEEGCQYAAEKALAFKRATTLNQASVLV